jgi:ATP-dependent DNA helicase 2 subunit 1
VTGSTRTFASLHKKMVEDELMALAWLIPRRNASPNLVGIIAEEEELDKKGAQISPPGMHCIILPFSDDIRQNPVDTIAECTSLV